MYMVSKEKGTPEYFMTLCKNYIMNKAISIHYLRTLASLNHLLVRFGTKRMRKNYFVLLFRFSKTFSEELRQQAHIDEANYGDEKGGNQNTESTILGEYITVELIGRKCEGTSYYFRGS